MKFSFFLSLVFCANIVIAQTNPLGVFTNNADIGNPKLAGSSKYDPATQTYTLRGAGSNIWFNRDEFQYLYKKIN